MMCVINWNREPNRLFARLAMTSDVARGWPLSGLSLPWVNLAHGNDSRPTWRLPQNFNNLVVPIADCKQGVSNKPD